MIVPRFAYLDTSALAKLYLPESGSDALGRHLAGRRDLWVSDLSVTEFASALARRTREGDLAARMSTKLYAALLRAMSDGLYMKAELTPSVHRAAERLLFGIGRTHPLRAADALHVALASSVNASEFFTFDSKLAAAVVATGTFAVQGEP